MSINLLFTWEAFIGAVSLMSNTRAFPLASLINMKAPPPMPLDPGLTTPKQREAATAASTACPPFRRKLIPIVEHRPSSVATAPRRATICSRLCLVEAIAPSTSVEVAGETRKKRSEMVIHNITAILDKLRTA